MNKIKHSLKEFINEVITNNDTKSQKYCISCKKTESQLSGEIKSRFCSDKLCFDCETLKHPERFHGCGFCKRPIRDKFSCTTCSLGFIDWVNDVIQPLDNISKLIRSSSKNLLKKKKINNDNMFIKRINDSVYKWPGFYAGITNEFSNDIRNKDKYFPVWIIPKLVIPYEINYNKFKLDTQNFERILVDMLKKNNINLYDDVQINLETMNDMEFLNFKEKQIARINHYDTRIIKHNIFNK